MKENNNDDYNKEFYPLTEKFNDVDDSNYLSFIQIANEDYYFLLFSKKTHGFHLVNWRVNFGNLHDFIIEKSKVDEIAIEFLVFYNESAPLLYQKLGLEY